MANDFSKIYLTKEPLVLPPTSFTTTAGAVVDFYGVVREAEGQDSLSGIEYEAYEEMALIKLRQIAEETMAKYGLEAVELIHRIGFVNTGEPSLFLRVTSGHRGQAFTGSREIIERLKQEVPIWKNPVIAQPI